MGSSKRVCFGHGFLGLCLLFLGFKFILMPTLNFHSHVLFHTPFSLFEQLHQSSNRRLEVASCGAGCPLVSLNQSAASKKSFAITINSSQATKYRLCNLVAFLQAQARIWAIEIDITVFSDARLLPEELCGDVTVIEWEVQSNHDRYFTRVRPLWERYQPPASSPGTVQGFGWIILLDDDSLLFLPTLKNLLRSYDPDLPVLIGGPSESSQSVAAFGRIPYGGGGMALSLSALATVQPALNCCQAMFASVFGGDEKLARCVGDVGASVAESAAFHQMDIRGNLSGYFEGVVSREPVVSLHHLYLAENMVFPPPASARAQDAAPRSVKHLALSFLSLGLRAPSLFCQTKTFYIQIHRDHLLRHGGGKRHKKEPLRGPGHEADNHHRFTIQWTIGYSLVLFESFLPFNKLLFHVDATFRPWQPSDASPYSLRGMRDNTGVAFHRYYFSCPDTFCVAKHGEVAPCGQDTMSAFVCEEPANLPQVLSALFGNESDVSKGSVWRKHVYSLAEGEEGMSIWSFPGPSEGKKDDTETTEESKLSKAKMVPKKVTKIIVDTQCSALMELKKYNTMPFRAFHSASPECIQFVLA